MDLQLRCFVADAAAQARVARLLAGLPLRIEQLQGVSAALAPADDPAPAAVVFVTDAAGAARTCSAMRTVHASWPAAVVVVLAHGCADAELLRLVDGGVIDFACLGSTDAELQLRLRRALGFMARPCPADTAVCADVELPAGLRGRLIGQAPAFLKLVRRVPQVAGSDATVLLLGETGTGKEVCAQAIHYLSARASGPWIAINCAAIPADLVETELFGHVRGAYTHALEARHGLVHEAEGGTLFLDEIDSMPLPAQAKLLRFLQDKQYRVVGASATRTANVRVIAASNRDLRAGIATHGFRQDLFFRLNILSLTLPPLRERGADVTLLAQHFFSDINAETGHRLTTITPAALALLQAHDWPGNVRELRHVLQRAVLLASGPALQAVDIELDGVAAAGPEPASFREAKAHAVEVFERHYLDLLMLQNAGNISRAARVAQKNRRAFFELLRRHEIDPTRYRNA